MYAEEDAAFEKAHLLQVAKLVRGRKSHKKKARLRGLQDGAKESEQVQNENQEEVEDGGVPLRMEIPMK